MMSVQTNRVSISTAQPGNERTAAKAGEADGDPRFGALMRRADSEPDSAPRPADAVPAAKADDPVATTPSPVDDTAPDGAAPRATETPIVDSAIKGGALKSPPVSLALAAVKGEAPETGPDARVEDAGSKETPAEPAKAAPVAPTPTPLTDAIALLHMVVGQPPAAPAPSAPSVPSAPPVAPADTPAAAASTRAKGVALFGSRLANGASTPAEMAAITAFVSAHGAAAKDSALPRPADMADARTPSLADPAMPAQGNAAPMPGTAPLTPALAAPQDLSASLGQQVIDMGSGGQWIDSLAREIASLSAGTGHGSFRLSPEHLGPMRVDIRPGAQGSDVTLTVETHAAEAMLSQDRGRLQADAQLAAVRIGEVKVERVAHVQEPARADTATGQGFGGNPSQSQGNAQGALAQGNANPNAQSQGNGQQARKLSPDSAVSTVVEPQDRRGADAPGDVRRARFA